MTQDVEKTTRLLATEILATLLISPFVIVYYTYLTYKSSGYMGPLAIYAYFVIATVINKFLLGPIVKLVVKQEKYEGDFRFKHVSVRTNAEAIGLYHSGSLERTMTNQKLENLISTQFQLIKRQLFLNFSTTTTDYIGGVLSYFIIAIPIFLLDEYAHMDPVDLTGVVSRNAFYYIYLISKFSVIIDLSSKIGDMSGTTHRIIQLFEKLEEIQEEPTAISLNAVVAENEGFPRRNGKASPNSSQRLLDPAHLSRNESEATDIYGSTHSGNPYQMSMERPIKTITLDNVSFGCPSDTEQAHLIKNLTLHVVLGTNILITGDSSSGKSSLIRVFAGLWNVSSGVFDGPRKYHPNKILFLPQKPYCPDSHASLAQQVMYPLRVQSNEVTPENTSKIESILESVRLSSLLTKCGGPLSPVPFDWLETLSPGELQRLSIARAFFHSPRLLFLDEATSALGFGLESELYSKLQKEGITTISVGHRLSLKRYHDYELHLDGKGGWTFSEIDLSTLEGTIADSTSTLGM